MFTRIKLFAIALFVLPAMAFAIFNSGTVTTLVRADDAAGETYKKQCAMCHSPKAEKLFDPEKTDEYHIEVILKGKKGAKPPYMPGFEAKGMTAEQAKALVEHMRALRKPAK